MSPTWWRGASRQPKYVAIGDDPRHLYRALGYLTGGRERAERLAMRLPARFLRVAAPSPAAEALVESALARQPQPHAALLLYTGHYKDTIFVGPVVKRPEDHRVVFWKAFRSDCAAASDVARIRSLQAIVPPRVVLATARRVAGTVVESNRILRRGDRLRDQELIECALEIGDAALRCTGEGAVAGPPAVSLDPDVVRWVASHTGLSDALAARMLEEVDRCRSLPLHLSHGDFTRWNSFPTPDGRIAVVDYDAVGLRPAYFDVTHLIVQGAAEQRVRGPSRLIRGKFAALAQGRTAFDPAGCLFWDAYESMLQFKDHPLNRAATAPTVRLKVDLWRNWRV